MISLAIWWTLLFIPASSSWGWRAHREAWIHKVWGQPWARWTSTLHPSLLAHDSHYAILSFCVSALPLGCQRRWNMGVPAHVSPGENNRGWDRDCDSQTPKYHWDWELEFAAPRTGQNLAWHKWVSNLWRVWKTLWEIQSPGGSPRWKR